MKGFDAHRVTNSSWFAQNIPNFKPEGPPLLKKPFGPGETEMIGYPR